MTLYIGHLRHLSSQKTIISSPYTMAEQTPLLSPAPSTSSDPHHIPSHRRRTSILVSLFTILLILATGLSVGLVIKHGHKEPDDLLERAKFYLKSCVPEVFSAGIGC